MKMSSLHLTSGEAKREVSMTAGQELTGGTAAGTGSLNTTLPPGTNTHQDPRSQQPSAWENVGPTESGNEGLAPLYHLQQTTDLLKPISSSTGRRAKELPSFWGPNNLCPFS